MHHKMPRLIRSVIRCFAIKCFLNFEFFSYSSNSLLYFKHKSAYLFSLMLTTNSFISKFYGYIVLLTYDIRVFLLVLRLYLMITFSTSSDALNFLYVIFPSAFNICIIFFTAFWNFIRSFIWFSYFITLLLYL